MLVVSRILDVSELETRRADERFRSMFPLVCIHMKENNCYGC